MYARGSLSPGVYVGAQRVWPPSALGAFPIGAGTFHLTGCPLLVETAQSIRVNPSAMTITGSRLSVDTGAAVNLAIGPGALDITPAPLEVTAGAAPVLQPANYSFAPQPLAVSAGQALTLGAGAMHLTPQALEFGTTSNVALNIVPGALQITYSPLTVNAGSAVALAMQPGAVTFAPQPLAPSAGAALPINAGAMTFTQSPLSVALGATFAVTPGAVTFAGAQPAVAAGAALDIGAGALAIAGQTLTEDIGAAATAPTLVDVGSDANSGTTVNMSVPITAAAGDTILAVLSARQGATNTGPSGFTLVDDYIAVVSTSMSEILVYTKTSDGTETSVDAVSNRSFGSAALQVWKVPGGANVQTFRGGRGGSGAVTSWSVGPFTPIADNATAIAMWSSGAQLAEGTYGVDAEWAPMTIVDTSTGSNLGLASLGWTTQQQTTATAATATFSASGGVNNPTDYMIMVSK